VASLAVAPDGRTLATGHDNGLVTLWELAGARPRQTIQAGARDGPDRAFVHHLAFTSDGKTLLTNEGSDMVRAWDVATGNFQRDLTPAHVWHVAYSPKKNLLATKTPDGVVLTDLATGSSETLPGQDPDERCVAFSPDGALLGGASRNKVLLWDV